MAIDEILVYSDGACSGNPGPGGWGSILYINSEVIELGGGHNATTNNRMEMTGVIEALSYCLNNTNANQKKSIRVFTDSVYVIRGITQWIHGWKKRGWKNAGNDEVSNQDLWIKLDALVYNLKIKNSFTISWEFVKGHAGIAGNERCDEIAVAYSKNDFVDLYQGSVENYHFDILILPEVRPLPEMKSKNSTQTPKQAWYLSLVNGVLTQHKTWKECEAVVKGRPAKFKKVTSEDEELAVKKSWGLL